MKITLTAPVHAGRFPGYEPDPKAEVIPKGARVEAIPVELRGVKGFWFIYHGCACMATEDEVRGPKGHVHS